MNYAELFDISGIRRISIKVTNMCNLSCEHCSNHTKHKISSKNYNRYRRFTNEMSVQDIKVFCKRFEGVGHKEYHAFSSAEPTTLNPRKLEAMIDVLIDNDRKVKLDTNGYGLMCLSEEYINKIDVIALDNHGINHVHVMDCVEWLNGFYKGILKLDLFLEHYDLQPSMEFKSQHKVAQKQCATFLTEPTLRGRVIYPCVNVYNIMVMKNETKLKEEMIKAGWTTDNPDVVDVMKNWRTTIPKEYYRLCLENCWYPTINIAGQPKVPITLKEDDVIKREC